VRNGAATDNRWELYRVLSEPVRLRLLALALEEELAVGELAELLEESQPNVSRHAASLKQAGLVTMRRQGTRTLLRTLEDAASDPVVADAIASGRGLCEANGSLAKIAQVVRARDSAARDFFAKPVGGAVEGPPADLAAYLAVFGRLLPRARLAIDAGTGEGGLLEVLAPVYERVVAVDREGAQLARAKSRVAARGYDNVVFALGDLGDAEVLDAVGEGADAVFAARLLHHAPSPARAVEALARLSRPGGAVVVLDYVAHEDEGMRQQADLWLGFEPEELARFARNAGLADARVTALPRGVGGGGPDAHLNWQVMVAHKKSNGRKARES